MLFISLKKFNIIFYIRKNKSIYLKTFETQKIIMYHINHV